MTQSKLPAEFHDITYAGDTLRLLTPEGVVKREFPFRPYFFVREEEVTAQTIETIQEYDETWDWERVSDYYQGELLQIKVTSPKIVSTIREELEIETLQSDIPYARRVLMDTDSRVTPTDDVLVFDIEVDASDGFPDVDEATSRILTICGMDTSGNEYVWAYDDEYQTLEEFFEIAEEYKCVMGWNSTTFDKPYVENRADNLGVAYDPFKYVHIDAMAVYRDILLIGRSNYQLETVVDEEFDETYYEFEDVDYRELLTYFREDKERLIEYNLEDVRAVRDLEQRYQFKNLVFDILAGDGYCRPEDMFYVREEGGYRKIKRSSNVLVEGIIINESQVRADEYPVIWPNKYQGKNEDMFRGADVLEPVPGLHENVVLLDFSSMYPAIIEALNVGPETFREDGSGDINAPIGSFVSEPESKFARAYRRAQTRRNEWKAKKKERTRGSEEWYVASAFDTGLKARTNTFYGVIGSRYSRFYNRNVAENITRMGAAMVRKTEELAENDGHTVIYGDTDSVILKLSDTGTDIVETGKQLAGDFTTRIKEWIETEYNADSNLIELTLDEVYESFFITDKKKRYAGMCVWAGSPCYTFEVTGFETVRGDTLDAVGEFQEELLQRIVQGEEAFDIVDEYRARLKRGELDDKLIRHASLSKPPDEYDSTPPHVRLAIEHDLDMEDDIPYVKYGNNPKDVVLAEGESYTEHLTAASYRYLWENNFAPIVDRLGLERHEQQGLGEYL